MRHKGRQKSELPRCQRYVLLLTRQSPCLGIENEWSETDCPGESTLPMHPQRTLSPQLSADTGEKLARIEWFRQVIVGAGLPAQYAVYRVAAGREHDDRNRLVLRPQPLTQGQAILPSHHDVQHHNVE